MLGAQIEAIVVDFPPAHSEELAMARQLPLLKKPVGAWRRVAALERHGTTTLTLPNIQRSPWSAEANVAPIDPPS